jgi:hypothetical protein
MDVHLVSTGDPARLVMLKTKRGAVWNDLVQAPIWAAAYAQLSPAERALSHTVAEEATAEDAWESSWMLGLVFGMIRRRGKSHHFEYRAGEGTGPSRLLGNGQANAMAALGEDRALRQELGQRLAEVQNGIGVMETKRRVLAWVEALAGEDEVTQRLRNLGRLYAARLEA